MKKLALISTVVLGLVVPLFQRTQTVSAAKYEVKPYGHIADQTRFTNTDGRGSTYSQYFGIADYYRHRS